MAHTVGWLGNWKGKTSCRFLKAISVQEGKEKEGNK